MHSAKAGVSYGQKQLESWPDAKDNSKIESKSTNDDRKDESIPYSPNRHGFTTNTPITEIPGKHPAGSDTVVHQPRYNDQPVHPSARLIYDDENVNFNNNRKRKKKHFSKSDTANVNINQVSEKVNENNSSSSSSSSSSKRDVSKTKGRLKDQGDDEGEEEDGVEEGDDGGTESSSGSKDGSNSSEISIAGLDSNASADSGDTSSSSPSSSSSPISSSTSSESKKKEKEIKKKKKKKRRGFWRRLMTSAPGEQRLLKMVLWFPVGLGISLLLYYIVIDKMTIEGMTKALVGGGVGLVLSLTFALSVQMRCIMCLVIPTFVGKAGRSYIAAFALVYLINGPITNIIDNSKEVVRSLTCNAALMANHTKEKWRLRLGPLDAALSDLQGNNFQLNSASRRVEKAFGPLRKEVEENKKETEQMEEHIEEMDAVKESGLDTVSRVEAEHARDQQQKDAGKRIEKEWEKKLDLRCEDTFARGVERCRDQMRRLESKCRDALSILGHFLCWPLKIRVFCKIIKLLPGAFGMKCHAADLVDPGFGGTFVDARSVVDDMDQGMKVQMQYKVVGSAQMDYTPVEEMRQATIHEVNRKASIVNFFFSVISHILTLTFLIIFHGAYTYNKRLKEVGFQMSKFQEVDS